MFIDELEIRAEAGHGGNGVVAWRRERSEPLGGPAGGNGGKGGDVYMRAVRDLSLLGKYTGAKTFKAGHGEPGEKRSRYGKDGVDLYIDVPVGATVTDVARKRVFHFTYEHEVHKILLGGRGGLGNEYFKSSTNRSPEQATQGTAGEKGVFHIELALVVDIGLIGFPNAGKSTLLNAITGSKSRVAAYPFTTTEPHLGDLYGFILADIPGLIEGASEGKGLGHKFLRHIERTKMLLHCVSLEDGDIINRYQKIRAELGAHNPALLDKEEWVLLTKSDIATPSATSEIAVFTLKNTGRVYQISAETGEGIKEFRDELVMFLRQGSQSSPETSNTIE